MHEMNNFKINETKQIIKWTKIKRSQQDLLTIIRVLPKPLSGLHLNGTSSCTRHIAIFVVNEKNFIYKKNSIKNRQFGRHKSLLALMLRTQLVIVIATCFV